jgi:ubiquinone/menaquinone biosynthesis C-methylase UbiE
MHISRVNRSKNDAKRTYDRLSSIYDFLAGSSETPLMHLGLELLGVGKGEFVLEIGSGTGKALVELCAQVGETGSVHAIDLSPGMLRVAHDRLVKADLNEGVSLLEGDGASLPYRDASFTAVFMSFTLELFDTPEIPVVIKECHRVLQLGGRLGVVSMLKSNHPGAIVRLYEWFHDKSPAYVDCRPINAGEMIQSAGFSLANSQLSSMWGLPVDIVVACKL